MNFKIDQTYIVFSNFAEEIGAGVLDDLHHQRETIQRSRARVNVSLNSRLEALLFQYRTYLHKIYDRTILVVVWRAKNSYRLLHVHVFLSVTRHEWNAGEKFEGFIQYDEKVVQLSKYYLQHTIQLLHL